MPSGDATSRPGYLTTRQLAGLLNVTPRTVVNWRSSLPDFPRPVRLTPRTVRYAEADVNAYLKRLDRDGGGGDGRAA